MAMIESLGKYRIQEPIGHGKMGVVYKALDPLLRRTVAIKVIADDLDVTAELKARFFREAQACAKLSHPNIVTVYDLGTEQGHLFIVMEFLDGQELRQMIARQTPLSVEDKLGLVIQVCDGLAYAHQKGIVHRDIKPANLFVLPGGVVKIMDFGIAKLATDEDNLTRTGLVMGTIRYMAPEQARGRADHRADIFSTAAVCYELVAEHPPISDADPMRILEELRSTAAPSVFRPDPAISDDLGAVIERALRKDPDERFATMEEMRAALVDVRARLRERAGRLRDRVRAQASDAVELETLLFERTGRPAAPVAPSPTEEQSVAELERQERQYDERLARLTEMRRQAEALAPQFERAMEHLRLGAPAAAVVVLERIVGALPEHARAQAALASARAQARQRAEAPETLDERAAAPRPAEAGAMLETVGDRAPTDAAADDSRTVLAPITVLGPPARPAEPPPPVVPPPPPTPITAPLPPPPTSVGATPPSPPPSPAAPTRVTAPPAPPATSVGTTPPSLPPTKVAPTPRPLAPVPPTRLEAAPPQTTRVAPTSSPPSARAQTIAADATESFEAGAEPPRSRTSMWARIVRRPWALVALAVVVIAAAGYWMLAPSRTASHLWRLQLEDAQRRVAAARAEALQVEANVLARAAFDRGTADADRANQSVRAGRFSEAIEGLRGAAGQYEESIRTATAAREARARADAARAGMRGAKAQAAAGTESFNAALDRERDGDQRYQQLAFDEAAERFRAAEQLFAKSTAPPPAPPAATAQPPGPSVAAQPPPPPAPPAAATERPPADSGAADADGAIRATLNSYARAFETRDLGLLQNVRPGMRPDDLARYRDTFDQTKSYRLNLKVERITVNGDAAEARGRRDDIVVSKGGETFRTSSQFSFHLKRVDGRWTIAAIK